MITDGERECCLRRNRDEAKRVYPLAMPVCGVSYVVRVETSDVDDLMRLHFVLDEEMAVSRMVRMVRTQLRA